MGGGPFQTSGGGQNTQGYQNLTNLGQTQSNLGTQTTGTTSQTLAPPNWAQPLLTDIAQQAFNVYGQSQQPQPGLIGAQNYAARQAPILGQATNWLMPYASGANVTGGSPAFREMLDYNAGRLANQINQLWSGAGRYGSAGQAANIGDVVGRFRQGATEAELARQQGLQLQALGMLPGAYGAGLLPYSTMQSVAQAPWQNLGQYAQTLSTLQPQLYGTQLGTTAGTTAGQTTSQTGSQSVGQTIGQQETQAPWFGTGGLANMGTLALALLSDRTEKTDIKKLGKSDATGLDIYSYRYKGDPKTYPKVVGPMAQDIEKQYPGSTDRINGLLYVKPHAIGLLEQF